MGNVTILLSKLRSGDSEAYSQLFTHVYDELTRLARSRLGGAQFGQLDAPSLVHEAYLRLSKQEIFNLRDRRDFFAYAAAVMRSVIVDLARQHNAQKRGSGIRHLTLSNADAEVSEEPMDVEALYSALEKLKCIDERAHRIVEMRYFAGMSIEEVATVLDLSTMTVKRSWRTARAFLSKELQR